MMLHLRLHRLLFYTSLLPLLASSLILDNNVNNNNQRPVLSLSSFAYRSAIEAGNIRIGNTQNKGLGAFALAPILNGTNVGAYEGEILTRPQVEARYWNIRECEVDDHEWLKSRKQRKQGISGDYLFDIGNNLYVDGEDADKGSWCRFMNHAAKSDTNACNVKPRCTRLTIGDGGELVLQLQPTLWFEAIRDIDCGEELSFYYGDSYWD
jgi:SET domain-containing protein